MDVDQEIRRRLQSLNPEALELHDDSAAHAGHAGAAAGGGHFELTVVSAAFAGQPALARHRQVYRLLADLIPARIHALQIRAFSPDEF
ncbi:BolA family transcriptional regulator [Chitiniphilus purpureus]|uniref:BolA family transcriptional regulator n=1 Tax=Chitiniphilus purpureus TaxID=2981137 RepID=A0ABY6DIP1_9NEIS|nr:BolA family protein [Chitiniphilus sp. CD1]UXY14214.1 BolA family transcriptional regulator [Chitiniphilus sp. CD1]